MMEAFASSRNKQITESPIDVSQWVKDSMANRVSKQEHDAETGKYSSDPQVTTLNYAMAIKNLDSMISIANEIKSKFNAQGPDQSDNSRGSSMAWNNVIEKVKQAYMALSQAAGSLRK